MTGPEHYRAAEVAIERAREAVIGSTHESYNLALARAHAMLALAAATAEVRGTAD